jgi:hypothetical protein
MSSISELRFVQTMAQVLNPSSLRTPKHAIVAGAGGARGAEIGLGSSLGNAKGARKYRLLGQPRAKILQLSSNKRQHTFCCSGTFPLI